ncbi:MAG: serine/threonine protein kinase [Muribaculum sp.]|nr:serine/threonine protein kinase [Muribaculum sp.]
MINSESTLKIGTILNNGEWRYKIVDVLGQGGFGITYLAIGEVKVGNVTTDAKFAIKEHFPSSFCIRQGLMVLPKDDKVEDYVRSESNFISEAKKIHILGTENENIVKVNEVFEENQTAYYVMQYINGVSLTDYVKSKKKLSYNETLTLLLPIVNAVDFLHKSRINHLDIKPDNIMLHDSIDGKVPVLIDFGLSLHFKKNGTKTSLNAVMGVTEGYSPLEQYAGIKEFNPATDIYALAATMLYALTGESPKGASDLKLSEVRTTLVKLAPQQTIDALCKALNKSYEDRTSSINAFKADLGLVTAGGTVTQPINPDDEKKKKTVTRVVLILFIAAIAITCFFCFKPSPNPIPIPEPVPIPDTIPTPEPTPTPIPPQPTPEPGPTPTPEPAPDPTPQPDPTPTPAPPKQVVTTGTLDLGYATWQGGIKNGKPDGKGRLTFRSTHVVDRHSSVEANAGDYFDATYDNGSLISGKLYDSNGNLLKTIIP